MKLYVDTNIFLDCLVERQNIFGNDISPPAQKIFSRAIKCEFHIIFSDHTAKELAKNIRLENARMLFELLKKKIIQVKFTKEDEAEARKLCPEHYEDALHTILANKHGADFLVTRNISDFAKYCSLIKTKRPEEL